MFTGLLLVTALAVAMGVELIYVADHLRGGEMYRMNTVFKFYIQVWLLFGAGSAAAIYYILYGVRDRVSQKEQVREQVVAPAPQQEFAAHTTQIEEPLDVDVQPVDEEAQSVTP